MIDATTAVPPMRAGNPTFDNAPSLNRVLEEASGPVFIPSGHYHFLTPPRAVDRQATILGHSMSETHLVRGYQPRGQLEGFLRLVGGYGSRIENLSLVADRDTQGGVGLALEACEDGSSVDYSTVRNLIVTGWGGTGTWSIGTRLHGARRTRPPTGLRDLHLDNLYLFASTRAALEAHSVHDVSILLSCYPAGGGTDLVSISGRPDSPCNNLLCQFRTQANLEMEHVTNSLVLAPSYKRIPDLPFVKFL